MVFPPTSREKNGGGFQIPDYESDEETTTTPGAGGTGSTGGSSRAETVFISERRPSGTVDSWQSSIPVYTSKSQAEGMWLNLLPERRQEIDDLAKAIDPRRTGKGLYVEAINAAALARQRGQDVTPATYINQLLLEYSQSPELFGDDVAGGRRSGAYAGPRITTSVSVTAKEDVERTLNTFAVDMLGRNLTDEELKKYTAEYRKQEMGAPRVTTTTPQGRAATTSVTEETVSRETIARNILQDNPVFADNVIKTDVLDMFFNRLGGASSGS